MTWVRALDAQGAVLGPVPSYVFNPGGMNQAMAHLKEVRPDRPARRNEMCRAIAKSVARHRSQKRVARIEIIDAYYVPEKIFGPARDEKPERERVLIACPIERALAAP